MKIKQPIFSCIFIFLIGAASCKKAYLPAVSNSPNSYLVVEGVINTGADSTIIKLSRTVNLSNGVTTNPLGGATVTVQNDQNVSYPLTETTTGNYASAGLNLDNTHQYRINIKTADNQQYQSALATVNITPPIDSIGYTIAGNMLQIYTNTHDPKNGTHYYRWDYTETWTFNAKYFSQFITNGTKLLSRGAGQFIYTCWQSDNSSTILLGSSAKLAQDVIYQAPVTQIQSSSEKIESRYSILLREYAMSPDAYNFYQNIKKNTEQLGSIFDAEPSEIQGNIHNVANPSETVIGYITACAVQTKRIFISRDNLPNAWTTAYPYSCNLDTDYFLHPISLNHDVAQRLIPNPPDELTISLYYPPGQLDSAGYFGASRTCADCSIRGTTIKPVFWR